MAERVLLYLLIGVVAVELAVVESFLEPVSPPRLPVLSVGMALAVATNIPLAVIGRRTTATTLGAALPASLWLLVVGYFTVGRREGDVGVFLDYSGLLFLLAGAAAYAVGIVEPWRSGRLSDPVGSTSLPPWQSTR